MKMDDKTHQEDGRKEASEVTVLAPQERDNFDGVTIEDARQDKDTRKENRQYYRGSSGQRGYVRTVSFGGSLGGLIGWLVLLGIVLFILPTFFLLAAAGAVVWFLLRLFR